MEQESEKKKKNVQPAEEKKPDQEDKEPIREPSIKDIISGIDPGKVKMAEKMGIPLTALIEYMAYQEQKLNIVIQNMPKKEDMAATFKMGLKQLQEEGVKQMQQQGSIPAKGGGQWAQLIPLIMKMASGGGEDSQLSGLAMTALKSQIGMSQAITNAVVAKIMGKATSDVADAVTK